MSIATETRVGRLAAEHPLATRVFARHGIKHGQGAMADGPIATSTTPQRRPSVACTS